MKSTREPRLGAWPQFYGVPVDPEIAQAVERAATLGRALGWGVDAFEPRGLERAPNLWATLFQWPLVALRKLVEGREEELHWTLLEAVGTRPREIPRRPRPNNCSPLWLRATVCVPRWCANWSRWTRC